jgi:hypothetical protein
VHIFADALGIYNSPARAVSCVLADRLTLRGGALVKNVPLSDQNARHPWMPDDFSFVVPTAKTSTVDGQNFAFKSILLSLIVRIYGS